MVLATFVITGHFANHCDDDDDDDDGTATCTLFCGRRPTTKIKERRSKKSVWMKWHEF